MVKKIKQFRLNKPSIEALEVLVDVYKINQTQAVEKSLELACAVALVLSNPKLQGFLPDIQQKKQFSAIESNFRSVKHEEN